MRVRGFLRSRLSEGLELDDGVNDADKGVEDSSFPGRDDEDEASLVDESDDVEDSCDDKVSSSVHSSPTED